MTQEIKTYIEKNKFSGWKAKSEYVLGTKEHEGKQCEVSLEITTYKQKEGFIVTSIAGGVNVPREGYAMRTTAIFQDYYKRINPRRDLTRSTEKAVTEAHNQALGMIGEHVAAARAQYGFN